MILFPSFYGPYYHYKEASAYYTSTANRTEFYVEWAVERMFKQLLSEDRLERKKYLRIL